MEFKRLNHLVALADSGSFVQAAAAVHLSQPAFSRSIQAAESEFGMKLFGRGGGAEVKCTPSGAFVVERARRVLRESRRLERDVSMFREGMVGTIHLGAGPFVAASLLPALLAQMRGRYPEAVIRVQVNNPIYLLEDVRSEKLDFFVGDTREVPRGDCFAIRAIGAQAGGFYVRAGHPLLREPAVRMAQLVPYALATGRLPDPLRVMMVQLMGLPRDASLPVAVECDDTHVLRRVALDSDTVMVGSDEILGEELRTGAMRPLPLADFGPAHSELGIVLLQARTPSPLARRAMQQLAALAGAAAEPPSEPRPAAA